MRMAKLDRLVMLLHALAKDAEGLSLDDMAARLEVSRRTAERLRDIVAIHFDLEELADGKSKRFRISGGLSRFINSPTAPELSALAGQAEALRVAGEAARAALLDKLLGKIRAALDSQHRRRTGPDLEVLRRFERVRVQAGPMVSIDSAVLVAVQEAILSGLALEFTYSPGTGRTGLRRVCAFGILHGPVTYLVGAFPDRPADPVMFRLDRMSAAAVSNVQAAPPASFDLDAYAARSFGAFQEPPHDIILRFSASVGEAAKQWRFHPSQKVEEQPQGSVVVSFTAGGLMELAEHLFSWGADVEIVAPGELRRLMVGKLRESLRHHEEHPASGTVAQAG